jgi:spore germination protein GerM
MEDNKANGVSEPTFVFFVAVTEPFVIFRRVARRIDHTTHQSFAAELNQLFGLPETRRFTGRQNYRRNVGLR